MTAYKKRAHKNAHFDPSLRSGVWTYSHFSKVWSYSHFSKFQNSTATFEATYDSFIKVVEELLSFYWRIFKAFYLEFCRNFGTDPQLVAKDPRNRFVDPKFEHFLWPLSGQK